MRIYAADGRLELRKPEGTLGYWTIAHEDIRGQVQPVPDPGIDSVAVDDLVSAIDGTHAPQCSLDEAYPSVAILESMLRSGERGGRWVDIRI